MRDSRGQASIDYVAILAVVAVVLGVAASAVGAPWLAPRVAAEIRHGICVVAGALCTPREAREAGLAPCPIHRRSNTERAGAVAVLRLARGDALIVERRSDGTAAVSFADSWDGGIEAGVGVTLPGAAGSVSGGVGARFVSGETFEFPDWGRAQRFLARFGSEETVTGETRRALRALCWRCPEWLEGRGRDLPEPTSRYTEGGIYEDFVAELGADVPIRGSGGRAAAGVGLDARGRRAVMLGQRRTGRQVTWYLRLESDVLASLGAIVGSLESGRATEGVLEVTTEAGNPVRARVLASATTYGSTDLAGLGVDLAGVGDRLRAATRAGAEAPSGVAVEVAVSLDLRDEANRSAVTALIRPGASPLGWLERVRALARRLDVAGEVDLRVLRAGRDDVDHTQEFGGLVKVGAGYRRVEETRDLIAAWSLRPGERLRRREDCEAATRVDA